MVIHGKVIFKLRIMSITAALFLPSVVHADKGQPEKQQVLAMQFGMFFGGSATLYDTCVDRGLIPAGAQKAEDQAALFIKASSQYANDKQSSDYVQRGWDLAKQKVLERDLEYWKGNCDAISKQWKKYVEIMKLK